MNNASVKSDFNAAWRESASLLFDFDGVLADSEPIFRRSWNLALEPWDHSIPPDDYWKYWSSLGEGLEGEIERHNLQNIDIQLARKRQKEIYEDLVDRGEVPLFPGTARLLEMLSSKGNPFKRPYGIASNTPFKIVRKVLLSGSAPVPLIVGGDGLPKKPAPDIFLRAASLLGCKPESTLIFEDSHKGITAARRGGFRSVLVLNSCNAKLDIACQWTIDGLQPIIDSIRRESIT